MSYCEFCGKEQLQAGNFCEHCGRKKTSNHLKTETEEVIPPPKKENTDISPINKPANKARKSNKLPLLFGGLALIGLITGGIVVVIQRGNDNDAITAEQTSITSETEVSIDEEVASTHGVSTINWVLNKADTKEFPKVALHLIPKYPDGNASISDFSGLNAQVMEKSESNTVIGEFNNSEETELSLLFLHDSSESMYSHPHARSLNLNNLANEAEKGRLLLGFGTLGSHGASIRDFEDGLPNPIDDSSHSWNFKYDSGQSAVYDGIIQGLDEMASYPNPKALVVYSDFIDNNQNSYDLDEVIQKAQESDIPVYVLGVSGEDNNQTDDEMQKLASETDGLYIPYAGDGINPLDQIYTDYQAKNHFVTLTFTATESDNTSREIEISSPLNDKTFRFNQSFSYHLEEQSSDSQAFSAEAEQQIDASMASVDGSYAVYLADVNDNANPVRADKESILGASTVKIFIMIEVLQQIKEGHLALPQTHVIQEDELVGGTGTLYYNNQPGDTLTIQQLLEYMMIESDNSAANMLIDLAGGVSFVNNAIQQRGFTATQLNRKMVDMEAIEDGKENYTSANDLGRALVQIYNKELLGENEDTLMLDLLAKNKNHSKIPASLPENTVIYNKTGEFEEMGIQNDAAIIQTEEGTYVLVVLTEGGSQDKQVDAIKHLSKSIYSLYTHEEDDPSVLIDNTAQVDYGELTYHSQEEIDERIVIQYLKKTSSELPTIETFQKYFVNATTMEDGFYKGNLYYLNTNAPQAFTIGTFEVDKEGDFHLYTFNGDLLPEYSGNIFTEVSAVEVANYFY